MFWKMCKKLLRIFLGSLMRIFFSLVSLFLIFGIAGWCFFKSSKKISISIPERDNVLYIKMKGNLVEEQTSFFLDKGSEIVFSDIYKILNNAIEDERISGLVLKFDKFSGGYGNLSELLNCLEKFKQKGKFITCYSDYYGTGQYLLASCADEIILSPAGGLDYSGFAFNQIYFKDFFDKIGIRFENIRVGEYKSASEHLTSNKMSKENRQQWKELLQGFEKFYLTSVSKNRNLLIDEVKNNLDVACFSSAKVLKEKNFITKIENFDMHKCVQDLSKGEKKYNIVKAKDYYADLKKWKNKKSQNKIMVLSLDGEISSNKRDLNAKEVKEDLKRIKKNKNVKAVVLKINSGGGSALESEKIYNEIKKFAQEVPVVSFIPNVGASGGYYIACGSDTIIAPATCITGSIGVIGGLLNTTKLQEKLGLNYDGEKTSPHADLSNFRDITNEEKKLLQDQIESCYDLFLDRVSENRKKTKAEIDKVARGRVWLGSAAQEVGLIDEVGGLEVALKKAAEKANLENYDTCFFSKYDFDNAMQLVLTYVPDFNEKILESVLGNDLVGNQLKNILFEKKQSINNCPQILAYCPFGGIEI